MRSGCDANGGGRKEVDATRIFAGRTKIKANDDGIRRARHIIIARSV
jgi:hypothetical protein